MSSSLGLPKARADSLRREPLNDHLIKSCLSRHASFIKAAEGVEGMDLGFARLPDGVGKATSEIPNGPNVEDEWMGAHHVVA